MVDSADCEKDAEDKHIRQDFVFKFLSLGCSHHPGGAAHVNHTIENNPDRDESIHHTESKRDDAFKVAEPRRQNICRQHQVSRGNTDTN